MVTAEPKSTPSIANWTEPVGVPPALETVAVKLTPWPWTLGFWLLVRPTELEALLIVKSALLMSKKMLPTGSTLTRAVVEFVFGIVTSAEPLFGVLAERT